MGKPTGFLEIERFDRTYRPVEERILHYREFVEDLPRAEISQQGARCMDCGIPYCHQGCPVNNIIPEWNDLVYRDKWREGLDLLHSTNNFPEFTGRVCPAPCEEACTLNITDVPVTIKTIECALVDRGWQEGWISPQPSRTPTDRSVAVIGSGPAGLACAQQLARAGHRVVVYEKNQRIGGLLRIGIPDFKMEKYLIDRRMAQMRAEGVEFHPNCHIGSTIPVARVLASHDAVALCGGSEQPRDLPVPGRELDGIHFAMQFLSQQNDRLAGVTVPLDRSILATDRHVVVIGGGDTGSDCVGTSIRQGALSVTQLELLPRPPERENKALTWPDWPMKLRTSSSHQEGCDRDWSVLTRSFSADAQGRVAGLNGVRLEWQPGPDGRLQMLERAGSEFTLETDLVLLAMGFVHPVHEGLLDSLGVARRPGGTVAADTDSYRTSIDKVFAAGDMRRGQSLVVWAIREGRQCARAIDEYLMGATDLPR
ncbi:MAG: glutamate synthase subunit beta [Alphaproteobacteria bacterium]|nr:glutamate synthase subunit beta [Alphaproteobacteria bacterium]